MTDCENFVDNMAFFIYCNSLCIYKVSLGWQAKHKSSLFMSHFLNRCHNPRCNSNYFLWPDSFCLENNEPKIRSDKAPNDLLSSIFLTSFSKQVKKRCFIIKIRKIPNKGKISDHVLNKSYVNGVSFIERNLILSTN